MFSSEMFVKTLHMLHLSLKRDLTRITRKAIEDEARIFASIESGSNSDTSPWSWHPKVRNWMPGWSKYGLDDS